MSFGQLRFHTISYQQRWHPLFPSSITSILTYITSTVYIFQLVVIRVLTLFRKTLLYLTREMAIFSSLHLCPFSPLITSTMNSSTLAFLRLHYLVNSTSTQVSLLSHTVAKWVLLSFPRQFPHFITVIMFSSVCISSPPQRVVANFSDVFICYRSTAESL